MADDAGEVYFEAPILDIEERIKELENFQKKAGIDLSDDIAELRERCEREKKDIFARVTPWQRVMIARESNRPDAIDYLTLCFEDFVELHGDKSFADDQAMLTGPAKIDGIRIMLIAHRKGKSTKERMACNFGSAHPEGYKKALEKMKMAEKFRMPVVTMVNTPGAYPGIGAEERGQATIIARNLMEMSRLRTPILSIVIGEGGSGGALGICVADRLSILENSYLSVISPEGCAAILWRDSSKAPMAAELLRMTPHELKELGIIDDIIPEPLGGAHRDHKKMGDTMREYVARTVRELQAQPIDQLLDKRYQKYRRIGVLVEEEQAKTVPNG